MEYLECAMPLLSCLIHNGILESFAFYKISWIERVHDHYERYLHRTPIKELFLSSDILHIVWVTQKCLLNRIDFIGKNHIVGHLPFIFIRLCYQRSWPVLEESIISWQIEGVV